MPRKLRLAVTDTETTGLTDKDQVCELAVATLEDAGLKRRRSFRWSTLIKPTCPVSLEARATHHISDAELAGAPTMSELLERRGVTELGIEGSDSSLYGCNNDVVMVAHNLKFDVAMLDQSGVKERWLPEKRICTWRCALHKYPDAPSHSNQVLRYYLELDVPQIRSLPPHRALPDAIVTACILEKMLETSTIEELIEMTTKPVLLGTCRMGEHAGKLWKDVDSGFLKWILAKGPRRANPKGGREIGFDDDVLYTVQHWLNVREGAVRAWAGERD